MNNIGDSEKKEYNFLSNEDPENSIFNKSSFEIENKVDDLNLKNLQVYEHEKSEKKSFKILKKYFKKLKKLIQKLLCNDYMSFLYGIFLTITWIYLYIISLEGCDKQQAECLKEQNHSTIIKTGKIILASSFSFFILVCFSIIKLISRFFVFLSAFIMIYLFYYFDTGADFAHHGSYNRVFFYLFFILLFLVLSTLLIIFIMIYKHPIKSIIGITLLVYFIYLKVNNFIFTSCDYWNKGFKDSYIRNDIGYCRIFTPSNVCFLKITNNLFDVTALRGLNCAKDRKLDEELNLLKNYIPDKFKFSKRIGFPRTENWDFFPESTLEYFNKNIFKSMVDMDDRENLIGNRTFSEKNKIIDETEVYIDFEKDYPQVVINLKKNETLIKERSEILSQHKNQTLFKNVIFIYLDALARNHFRRKLTKTYAWLEQFYDNSEWKKNKNDEENIINNDSKFNYSSYQFLKYHAVDYYTYANMIPGYFGVHKWDEKGTYFLYDYKKAGYITGQSTNVCEREGWDLEMAFEPYLNYTNYDHEFNAFYCDPNFSDPDSPYQVFKGAYSVIRKCMYGKDSGEFQIEYAKQFFETYKDQNKFYRMIFSDAHEGTLEVVKYLDDMLHDFFEFLLNNGHLENSILLVMSDHGISLPGPAYLIHAKDWFSEVFLPSLFFVIPKNHENFREIDKNLKNNEMKWITSFDINSSVRSFANRTNTYTNYGQSIVMEGINEDYRSCGFYRMTMGYCLCNWEP